MTIEPPVGEQVRVRIISSGVCASDAHFVWGSQKYTDFPGWYLPAVLGHEAACIVESVGGDVFDLEAGDHVLTTFMPSCGQCGLCANPQTNMCTRDNLLTLGSIPNKKLAKDGTPLTGMAGLGVYAEFALLQRNQVVIVSKTHRTVSPPHTHAHPDALFLLSQMDKRANLKTACIISCSICTGFFSAVNLAKVTADSTCAIWGMGAIGLNAVLGCKFAEAKHIIGIDINPDKMDYAFSLGCTEFINPTEMSLPIEQYLKEKYGGVDFALECIGNQKTMNTALASLSMIGTLAIIGIAPSGSTITAPIGDLMTGKKIISGFLGNKDPGTGFNQLVSMVLNKEINLEAMITQNFKLEQINEAFQMLKEGKCVRSVILMEENNN